MKQCLSVTCVHQEVCEACDESCKHCSGPGPESCVTCLTGFGLHAITRRCVRCCQLDESAKNCCPCHSASGALKGTNISYKSRVCAGSLIKRISVLHFTSYVNIIEIFVCRLVHVGKKVKVSSFVFSSHCALFLTLLRATFVFCHSGVCGGCGGGEGVR